MRDDSYFLDNLTVRRLGYGREPLHRHPEQAHGHKVRIHESQIAPIAQREHAVDAAATLRQWGWNASYDADPDMAVWIFATRAQKSAFENDFHLVTVPMLSGGVATRIEIDAELRRDDLAPEDDGDDDDEDDDDLLPLGVLAGGW